jgi:hypothetical protein
MSRVVRRVKKRCQVSTFRRRSAVRVIKIVASATEADRQERQRIRSAHLFNSSRCVAFQRSVQQSNDRHIGRMLSLSDS